MKKYRITKITVKTREIISVSKNANDENRFPVCPLCHATLDGSPEIDESSAGEFQNERQIKQLSETKLKK